MPSGDIWMVLVPVLGAAAVWAVREFVRPANALGLSLFRPYRGETWPRGVQEDYDVHFDWSPHKSTMAAPAPIQPTWSDIVVAPTVSDRPPAASPAAFADDVEIEDLIGESAAISQVQGDIHIAPR